VKQRRYHFVSEWEIVASPETVWQTVTATPFSWDQWWPELVALRTIETTPSIINTRFSTTFRARTGYQLGINFTVTEVEDLHRVVFKADGDLAGIASWEMMPHDTGTHIRVDWRVVTTKPWMNLFATFLKPIFTNNHAAVMRSGEIGLNRFLKLNSLLPQTRTIKKPGN
jgi:hypothetical protein